MKKLNTILILLTLLLGASGVQAKLSGSDIASGVQVARNYKTHKEIHDKQYNLLKKIHFLKIKIKKMDQTILEALASRKHLVYLEGVHQYRTDEARKNVNHLKIVGATEDKMQLASDLLYLNIYQLDKAKANKKEIVSKIGKLSRNVHAFRVTVDKSTGELRALQAKYGVRSLLYAF